MAFTWTTDPPLDADLRSDIGLDEAFATREDAQAWLSDVWPELLDAGAAQVTLFCNNEPVYTMNLND